MFVNKSTVGLISFAAGAAIGSVATWIFIKKKYEKIAQEEIDSVKEVFAKKIEEAAAQVEENDIPEFDEEDYEEYGRLTNTYCDPDFPHLGSGKAYTISPTIFGEIEDYERFNFTYYADGTLTDENDCIIEDVEGVIGLDVAAHFGEFEDDAVHVRNDRLKCEFEILYDQRDYAEVLNQKPYLAED